MNKAEEVFDSLIKQHGANFLAVGYSSKESLELRYKVLAEVLPNLNGLSILDVGCGYGGIYEYISNFANINYTGIDVSKEMINAAKRLYPSIEFIHGDFNTYDFCRKFDLVIANGIFTTLKYNFEAFYLIRHMLKLAKKAIAFTAVCTWPYGESEEELRIDPINTLSFVGDITKRVTLRMDYRPGDCCFYVYK